MSWPGGIWVSRPTRARTSGLKVASLVAGMVAGADSIDDMALLRHGGMGKVVNDAYAPSTLGSFLRAFTFGHVRQLDAVASRFLVGLAEQAPLMAGADESRQPVMVDIDDTIIEVHGYTKQGSGYGYCGVSRPQRTPRDGEHERHRAGDRGPTTPQGIVWVTPGCETVGRRRADDGQQAVGHIRRAAVGPSRLRVLRPRHRRCCPAGQRGGVGHRAPGPQGQGRDLLDPADAWTSIDYTDAVFDEQTNTWVSHAEVAEVGFTAFSSRPKTEQVTGRLVIRRIPDLNPADKDGQNTLFDTWRFHAFFTTTSAELADTVAADKIHRGHAIIEQVHADLKNSALAHLPSATFTANAAWLVLAVMAFNLTRAAATISGPALAKATTATIRRKLITVPARTASSARRPTLHLPTAWPWQTAWTELFTRVCGPPRPALS